MKKFLIILAFLALLIFIAFLVVDEDLPVAEKGPEAEELTDKMFASLNKPAWDSLAFIRWSFRDAHHYIWNKEKEQASISWDDYQVLMDLNEISGQAYQSGTPLTGSENDEALKKAWSYWCNDSFWLIAPFKARDPGTVRKYLKLDDGLDGLLVQYESGGVTPGDAYLWGISEDGIPQYYKMWVSIIPIGGVKATWDNWKKFESVKISTKHKLGPLDIPVGDIQAGKSLDEIGADTKLFSPLNSQTANRMSTCSIPSHR